VRRSVERGEDYCQRKHEGEKKYARKERRRATVGQK